MRKAQKFKSNLITSNTMKHRSPFQQFLSDSGVKITKNALVMGLPYNMDAFKKKENAKTTRNSSIPNKF